MVAVGRFAADVQAVELELAQAPDAGGEVADHGIHFIGGQGLQRRTDVGQGDQIQVRMVGAEQFMGGVVLHHGNFQPVQILEAAWFRAAFMGQDDDGKVEIGACEGQEVLAFGGGHNARQQVELIIAGLFKHCGPVNRFDQFDSHTQAVLEQAYVIGCQALISAIFIAIFKRWPRRIHA